MARRVCGRPSVAIVLVTTILRIAGARGRSERGGETMRGGVGGIITILVVIILIIVVLRLLGVV